MRVIGDLFAETVSIEDYFPIPGTVEVRIRENIKPYQKIDSDTGDIYTGFICDEYIFHMPKRDGLREEIENNLEEWLATGRTMEINEKATLVQEMKEALEVLGVSTDDINQEVK